MAQLRTSRAPRRRRADGSPAQAPKNVSTVPAERARALPKCRCRAAARCACSVASPLLCLLFCERASRTRKCLPARRRGPTTAAVCARLPRRSSGVSARSSAFFWWTGLPAQRRGAAVLCLSTFRRRFRGAPLFIYFDAVSAHLDAKCHWGCCADQRVASVPCRRGACTNVWISRLRSVVVIHRRDVGQHAMCVAVFNGGPDIEGLPRAASPVRARGRTPAALDGPQLRNERNVPFRSGWRCAGWAPGHSAHVSVVRSHDSFSPAGNGYSDGRTPRPLVSRDQRASGDRALHDHRS